MKRSVQLWALGLRWEADMTYIILSQYIPIVAWVWTSLILHQRAHYGGVDTPPIGVHGSGLFQVYISTWLSIMYSMNGNIIINIDVETLVRIKYFNVVNCHEYPMNMWIQLCCLKYGAQRRITLHMPRIKYMFFEQHWFWGVISASMIALSSV